ncbi:HD domain-containing protein [Subsaximicrobium wynnwilliamsii]|uniref:HD domain-containing protein n=1 Tax=Subsaximicrobium wynnwilliamsii TaxID=291179 RepID=A0A5C6ZN78_9FLAO|nr:Pycsar system effector family protein [Subsaximicrobium wynnwilliamsii]TXD85567.1 HD domain-containing protein [Subsaximicrobium wynnwilliamsii]TXD90920.1 HD domain-containing protein [Subsaximicrobium wynnwilliamsii]TXE05427.1 HD domain-containing protein [Subsaximicrobium wynnwilliamsii]
MASDLIKKTEAFVFELFKNELDPSYLYHNYKHTERVLKSTKEIIEHSEISEEDILILKLAALLHDTGYIDGTKNHEERSVEIGTKFLNEQNVDQAVIEKVNACIMATKFNDSPKTELDKIIRDADSSHFGKDYFEEASEFLRKELELREIKSFTGKEWRDENIKMLSKKHQYYTDYALKNWQESKEENLTDLLKAKKKQKRKYDKEKIKAKYKAQYKNESPERGIQTFFRVALRNHIKLSDIADTKANILLSVNAIIISLVLANMIAKLDNNAYLIYPTAIFTLFCVVSMILSIIATRPNITSGEFTKEDVKNKDVNLTFFGNFHKMKLEDFEWAITELLKDKNYVYSSLTKDLYFLGVVLERKYRILRITYTVFMIGIIVSVITFAVALKTNGKNIDDVLPQPLAPTSYIQQDKTQSFWV